MRDERHILLDIIDLAEELEDFAVGNYHHKTDPKLAQTLTSIINWSYKARLDLGYDKETVLDRYENVSKKLERARNTIRF